MVIVVIVVIVVTCMHLACIQYITVGGPLVVMRFLGDHLPAAALLVVPNTISVPASSLDSAPTVVLGFSS